MTCCTPTLRSALSSFSGIRHTDSFDPSVSRDAVEDTAENLKLAIKLRDKFFPLRDTAYKSLLDRAKIGGSALPKLSREKLADVINACLALHKDSALLLIRDEKVSAAHSGDSRDYSVLEIDQLLDGLQSKMDERFPGNQFSAGYVDHAITSASWTLPGQREELLDTYIKLLAAEGKSSMAAKLMPGIRFSTSDTGMASAKIDDDHIADIIQGRPTILLQEVRDVIFAKVRSYACEGTQLCLRYS